jgi:CHAD domain-containing protein
MQMPAAPAPLPTVKESLLELPVEQVLRRLVRRHLAAAARGLERTRDPDDHKALHAFRVAIRRLRSLLRAYHRWLGRVAGKKPRRRLRDLARATNAARDAHVLLTWLGTQKVSLEMEDQPGLAWMRKRLHSRQSDFKRSCRGELTRDFARVTKLLRNRLAKMKVSEEGRFRSAFGEVFAPTADEFRLRLAAIMGSGDYKNIHRTRIQVKRLRYLVEPLRNMLEEARAVDQRLRKLQKLLGSLHDIQIIEAELAAAIEVAAAEKARRMHELAVEGETRRLQQARRRDEGLGLLVLAGRARAQRDTLYGAFVETWLAGRADALDRELRALGNRLTQGQQASLVKK